MSEKSSGLTVCFCCCQAKKIRKRENKNVTALYHCGHCWAHQGQCSLFFLILCSGHKYQVPALNLLSSFFFSVSQEKSLITWWPMAEWRRKKHVPNSDRYLPAKMLIDKCISHLHFCYHHVSFKASWVAYSARIQFAKQFVDRQGGDCE